MKANLPLFWPALPNVLIGGLSWVMSTSFRVTSDPRGLIRCCFRASNFLISGTIKRQSQQKDVARGEWYSRRLEGGEDEFKFPTSCKAECVGDVEKQSE